MLYVTNRHLPRSQRPCAVVRENGSTLVAIHVGVPRLAVVKWAVANLTPDEHNAMRAGYGQPPIGQRIDDECLDGPTIGWIPDALRLPQEREVWDGVA